MRGVVAPLVRLRVVHLDGVQKVLAVEAAHGVDATVDHGDAHVDARRRQAGNVGPLVGGAVEALNGAESGLPIAATDSVDFVCELRQLFKIDCIYLDQKFNSIHISTNTDTLWLNLLQGKSVACPNWFFHHIKLCWNIDEQQFNFVCWFALFFYCPDCNSCNSCPPKYSLFEYLIILTEMYVWSS